MFLNSRNLLRLIFISIITVCVLGSVIFIINVFIPVFKSYDVDFKRFNKSNKIEVMTYDGQKTLKVINDVTTIKSITEFLSEQRNEWMKGIDVIIAIGPRLDFYDGKEFLGYVGFSDELLTAESGYYKSVTTKDIERLKKLVDIDTDS